MIFVSAMCHALSLSMRDCTRTMTICVTHKQRKEHKRTHSPILHVVLCEVRCTKLCKSSIYFRDLCHNASPSRFVFWRFWFATCFTVVMYVDVTAVQSALLGHLSRQVYVKKQRKILEIIYKGGILSKNFRESIVKFFEEKEKENQFI